MSKIEWTDVTWNPVIGCAKVSAGCGNCYAERSAHRVASLQGGGVYLQVLRTGTDERGYIDQVDPRWNGRAVFLPERLGEPLRWRKPCRVFVNSMSDLFHEDVNFEQIAAVFGVMAATPRHTFQVLTKRPARMLEFFRFVRGSTPDSTCLHEASVVLPSTVEYDLLMRSLKDLPPSSSWPLPNVHLGVSVEDQRSADERIPLLLQCPAALRFLSVEPLLGPVTLLRWTCGEHGRRHIGAPPGIGWVIVGGESGPGARPCGVDWIRSVVEQCKGAGVPVFVKQLGARPTFPLHTIEDLPADHLRMTKRDGRWHLVDMRDRKGADPSEWPEDLRVQESPR